MRRRYYVDGHLSSFVTLKSLHTRETRHIIIHLFRARSVNTKASKLANFCYVWTKEHLLARPNFKLWPRYSATRQKVGQILCRRRFGWDLTATHLFHLDPLVTWDNEPSFCADAHLGSIASSPPACVCVSCADELLLWQSFFFIIIFLLCGVLCSDDPWQCLRQTVSHPKYIQVNF